MWKILVSSPVRGLRLKGVHALAEDKNTFSGFLTDFSAKHFCPMLRPGSNKLTAGQIEKEIENSPNKKNFTQSEEERVIEEAVTSQ